MSTKLSLHEFDILCVCVTGQSTSVAIWLVSSPNHTMVNAMRPEKNVASLNLIKRKHFIGLSTEHFSNSNESNVAAAFFFSNTESFISLI